jgi:hypothetical protein
VIVGAELARPFVGTLIPLGERDLVAAYCEWTRHGNSSLRLLVRSLAGSHHEVAGRDDHKFWTALAVPENLTRLYGLLRPQNQFPRGARVVTLAVCENAECSEYDDTNGNSEKAHWSLLATT